MDLDFHAQKIDALTPKAAKIALRMLDADPRIPTEWIMTLRPALVGRSVEADGFKSTDWMTMAAIERPAVRRFAEYFESKEQRHARLWVLSLRKATQRLHHGNGSNAAHMDDDATA
ncbi:MAG: hypothetical protein ABWZ88_17275 [Variovorax sp.]